MQSTFDLQDLIFPITVSFIFDYNRFGDFEFYKGFILKRVEY